MSAKPAERDLVFGITAIADCVRDELGEDVSDRQVAYMIETKRIPSGLLGRRRIGSRSAIRETLVTTACGGRAGRQMVHAPVGMEAHEEREAREEETTHEDTVRPGTGERLPEKTSRRA
jgi:hypothetical protein